tara:strand:- start:1034 stop:1489 length:456 start_codon:yes stop_codon:yes gene_type:complete
MEWTRVNVQSDDEPIEDWPDFEDMKMGLDTDAESMHESFLKSMPHLSEVQERHVGVVSDIESRALSSTVSSLGDFLSEFGGEWSETEIRVPLQAEIREDVVVDTKDEDGDQLVRIISPERFGGMLRSFRLPDGRKIHGARWEGDILSIKID